MHAKVPRVKAGPPWKRKKGTGLGLEVPNEHVEIESLGYKHGPASDDVDELGEKAHEASKGGGDVGQGYLGPRHCQDGCHLSDIRASAKQSKAKTKHRYVRKGGSNRSAGNNWE